MCNLFVYYLIYKWIIIWASAWISNNMVCATSKAQISLLIRTVWSEPLLVAWIFYECKATDSTSFGGSKLKMILHRLVWVYTCQNATVLEITNSGSYYLHGLLLDYVTSASTVPAVSCWLCLARLIVVILLRCLRLWVCLLETMLVICCFFFPGIMFIKKQNKWWMYDRVQSLRLQTSQSDPLSIRNSPHLKVSICIYSYLKVREGNGRDVVRIYWYLSAMWRFNGTHQSADIRIYPQWSVTTRNYR